MSPDLEAAVLAILRAHPDGISEFALFAELARGGFAEFEREVFADRMKMFRSHFVLFHVLYVIREELVMRREGHLTIEAMQIRLVGPSGSPQLAPPAEPPPGGITALADHDPLRDYYLDLSNCDAMTDEELRSMLDRFWERFQAHDGRGDALRVLGLSPGVSWDEVKSRHRALVFEHHPDRGGDAAQLAAINAAMRVLEVSKP